MKNLKSYLKNDGLLIVLCVVFLSTNVLAMRSPEGAGQSASRGLQRRLQRESHHENQYFLYGKDDPNNGIWVDKESIKANCEALRDMIVDFGETQEVKIPIGLFPIAVIRLGFDVLANKVNVPNLSFTDLIDVANIFNFLGAPADKMKPVLDRIVDNLSKISDEELKKLNPDVQKLLMTDPTINYLKDCIIKNYAQERKQVLVRYRTVLSAAFSSDGTKIASGGGGVQNNFIVLDIANPHNITRRVLVGHPANVNSVAFSPDGKYIVSGCGGIHNNLILWDMSNPHNITHQVLVGHPRSVTSVAFSPDGKHIVSGCLGDQNNLIVWDVSDPHNITHQALVGHPDNVNSVAFSPDGKHIVSGCLGDQNNLIVWDVSDLDNITRQILVGHPGTVKAVAFSPDGKHIASGYSSSQSNLIIWDISDQNNITHQVLVGHPNAVHSIAFSPDSTKIVSGSYDNLILWNITNSHNITHQAFMEDPGSVTAVAFSPDGKKMLSGNSDAQNNLIVWTLLTDQEDLLLKQLIDYNVDQISLIYRLCLKVLKGRTVQQSSEEQTVFKTLSQEMQRLLTDLLLNKG